jgi:hypothetical protein
VTALATSTRLDFVALLEAGTKRLVHSPAPKVPVPPCLVVIPDVGWMSDLRMGNPKRYELRLKVMVVGRDNAEGLTEVEQGVEDVVGILAPICLITEVTPPALLDTGAQGSVLVSEVKLSIQVKE